MEMPVGVGGAVMEGKGRAPGLFPEPVIYADLLPALETVGLSLGQPGADGKIGLGQV